MATLLNEEAVLSRLDLRPRCERKVGSFHDAQVAFVCRGCRRCVFLCRSHAVRIRRQIERALRRATGIECSACHRKSPTFDEAIEVVEV
ncbi:hypothetical protein [Microbacterium resistens]|uniref:hypothetical protein n=1 Tax=Microbacterium resistens TaxID=156977 RepID=UPI00366AB088